MITLEEHITASGKYPERLKDKEVTDEVKANINKLLDKINKFLGEIGISKSTVSSGFRPSGVNASIPNAAKKSSHMIGNACDIVDGDGKLDELVSKHPELLRKYGLFQEDPEFTKGWCHLDDAVRTDRPSRQFKP